MTASISVLTSTATVSPSLEGSGPPRAGDQAEHGQQDDGADEGHDQGPDEALRPFCEEPQLSQNQPAQYRPDYADHDVAEAPEPTPFDHPPGERDRKSVG